MERISSDGVTISNKAYAAIWLTVVAVMSAIAILSGAAFKQPLALLGLLGLGALGYVLMARRAFALADEVLDAGDHLLITKDGVQESVRLSNIWSVDPVEFSRSPQVKLEFILPCKFGSSVVFSPKMPLLSSPFSGIPIVKELRSRVQQARESS